MDPVTAGLFVGASMLTSIFSNRTQAKIERTNADLQAEQAKLQASEAAFERTKAFRQNVANNLALSGMGFGSTAGFATTTAESYRNFMSDINSLDLYGKFADTSLQAAKAGIKSKTFSADIGSIESAYSLATKLGLFV